MRSFILLLVFALFPTLTPAETIYIDINQVSQKPFPIALVPPIRDRGGEDRNRVNERFIEAVRKDLALMGMFHFIQKEAFLEDAAKKTYSVTDIDFAAWAVLDALAVVKGWYRIESGRLTLEARLFDVLQKHELAAKRYEGPADQVETMGHRFANEIMRALTGQAGLFTSRIAFIGAKGRNKELYVMNFNGDSLRQLTKQGSIALSPEWAADGKSIFFTSFAGGRMPQLHRFDLAADKSTRISNLAGMLIGLALDPTQDLLATALTRDGNSEIYLVDLTGRPQSRLTINADIDVSASFSPDGKQLAFVSSRDGYAQIYKMDRDGKNVQRLTFKGRNNTAPAWSPKGDKILFAGMDNDGHFDIFSINVDGSGMVRLTYDTRNNEEPAWSPGGELITFSSDRTGKNQLYVMRPDGTHQVQLTSDPWDHLMPVWEPKAK